MNCLICHDTGLVTYPDDEFARVRLCDCSSECPDCHGRGFKLDASTLPVQTIPCPCGMTRLRARASAFTGARLPARLHDRTFDNYVPACLSQEAALADMKHFAEDYESGMKGLVLWGRPGTGKTHLMVALTRELTLGGKASVTFVDFFQLLSEIKGQYAEGYSETAIIKGLMAADVLIVDELGKGRGTDWEVSILDQVISRRYNAGRTIVGTSNYDPAPEAGKDGLKARMDDRIYSRLCEVCDFIPIEGPDHRRRGQ